MIKSAYATQKTRTGELNMKNRKPFRNAKQKERAKEESFVLDGRFVSHAPVSHHPK